MTPPRPSFAEFQQLVIADTALFDRLAAAQAQDAFVTLAVQLGIERGFCFTADDVSGALQTYRRDWMERNLG